MTPRRSWSLVLAALAVLTVLLRLAWIVPYERHHPQADRPVIDEAAYDAWARELAAGDWLGDEVFFQEPLYPYVLGAAYAVFGADTSVARGLNVLCAVVFVLLTAATAARLAGQRAGLAAGLCGAAAVPLVHTTALILKPSLFLALMSALVWELVRGRAAPTRAHAVRLGALCALGALVRGNALLLLPLVIGWPFVQRCIERDARVRPWRLDLQRCALAALGAAAVLLPVAARNQIVGGVFAPTTSGAGTNLHIGNHPQNEWGVASELDFVRGIPEHEAEDWEREAERRLGRDLDPGEVSAYWLAETVRSFVREPLVHAAIFARKLRLALHRGEVADNHSLRWDVNEVRAAGGVSVLDLPLGGWFPWGALGVAGALVALRRRGAPTLGDARAEDVVDWPAAREVAVLAAAYLATLVLTVVVGRMRLPLYAFVLPLAPLAPMALAQAWRRPGAGLAERAWPCAALAVAFVAALAPARPGALEEADLIERDFNLAVQLLEEGALDEAHARVARVRGFADPPRVRALAAEIELARAQRARAAGDDGAQRLALEAARRVLGDSADVARASEGRAPTRDDATLFAVAGRLALFEERFEDALVSLAVARAFDPSAHGVRLDELRARASALARRGADAVARRAAFEPLRADAASLAQAPELPPDLRTPARILWAELEAAAAAGVDDERGRRHVTDALKVLKGTLDSLPAGDLARVAVHVAAADVQLGLGNGDAARGQLEAAARLAPQHAGVRRRLAELTSPR